MFKDLDIVTNKREITYIDQFTGEENTIPVDSFGTVLIVYSAEWGFEETDPLQYEVEFCDDEGYTLGLLPVSEADLEFESSYEQRQAAAKARDALP
jgi:hypothetical protein